MKAAVLKQFYQPLVIEDVPMPKPGPQEVLVKVMASGLCGSDIHIQEGKIKSVPLPHIPGHEMAGVVEEVGEGCTRLQTGERVVSSIDITLRNLPLLSFRTPESVPKFETNWI